MPVMPGVGVLFAVVWAIRDGNALPRMATEREARLRVRVIKGRIRLSLKRVVRRLKLISPLVVPLTEPKSNSSRKRRALSKLSKLKPLKVRPVLRRVEGHSPRTGLLDSGASSCLRSLRPDESVEGLHKRIVDLAEGCAELLIKKYGALISTRDVECIVALRLLIKLGCHWFWSEGRCELVHPKRGVLVMDDSSGCPRMTEDLALGLIQDIEEGYYEDLATSVRALQLLREKKGDGVQDLLKKVRRRFALMVKWLRGWRP